ncbi:MAG: hypothetical protein NTW11_00750 [Candidatus Staskawiczbacteria bacterium]|nr:hypothetical protein [Candidatus Staskawiczbacteria bacterium]
MIDNISLLGAIFILITLAGFYLAYLYGRKTKKFRWSEYVAIVIWPILAIIVLSIIVDIKIFSLFIISCAVGFILEYIVGLAYHKTLNKRLWEYKRLSVNGYTSLLTIPIWGVAGCVFWFIGKMVGL